MRARARDARGRIQPLRRYGASSVDTQRTQVAGESRDTIGHPGTIRTRSVALVTALLALGFTACSTTREAELFAARLSSDGRSINLGVGACNPRATDVTMDQASEEVQVLVTVTDPVETDDCDTEVTIDLDDPLGERALIDASTQRRVDVAR